MRIENSKRNSIFGLLRTFLQIVLKFIVRTVFIKILGNEYLGLDSLFASILQVLSLAELGFGSAIVYSMYEPIAKNDDGKVAALLSIYKKIYFIVGAIILCAGFAIVPFLKYFIQGNIPSSINIHIVFIVFLFNTVSGYFFAYKRSILYAHQRSDIESKIGTIFLVVLNLVQIILLLIFRSYYFYIIIIPIFTILENVVIFIIVGKTYPNIIKQGKLTYEDKKSLRNGMIAMIGHKIGSVAVFSTDNILMSAFLGLAAVGIYNNYYLIIGAIASFIGVFIRSIGASIGNSIAEESVEKNYKNFIDLSFLNFWIIGFCATCLLILFQPFIAIWIGVEYQFSMSIVVMIVINFCLQQTRNIVNVYRETTGTFYNDRFKPLIETVVNLITSMILARYFGLIGILIGTTISTVFVALPIEAYTIFKNYFHKPILNYLLNYIISLIIILIVTVITFIACMFLPSSGVLFFILKVIICLILPNLLYFVLSFRTPQFKYFKTLFMSFFKKQK